MVCQLFAALVHFSLGVYAFGFLFMLPQLFVNYKVSFLQFYSLYLVLLVEVCCSSSTKSIHVQSNYALLLLLPLSLSQAFNTFIDDVFAFIITMPTSHRVAVFRDDLVFFIYLFQRWYNDH